MYNIFVFWSFLSRDNAHFTHQAIVTSIAMHKWAVIDRVEGLHSFLFVFKLKKNNVLFLGNGNLLNKVLTIGILFLVSNFKLRFMPGILYKWKMSKSKTLLLHFRAMAAFCLTIESSEAITKHLNELNT